MFRFVFKHLLLISRSDALLELLSVLTNQLGLDLLHLVIFHSQLFRPICAGVKHPFVVKMCMENVYGLKKMDSDESGQSGSHFFSRGRGLQANDLKLCRHHILHSCLFFSV